MAKDLAIVLNNGSINSLVTAALAAQKYRPIMLYAEIAAQPGSRVRAAYDQQVAHFKPYREHTLPMPFLSVVQPPMGSAPTMTDPRLPAVLGPQMLELLPLVSAAARFGAHYQVSAIYFGLRVGSSGDELAQATEYVQIWNELIQLPCGQPELEVVTPLLELEPWQVVDAGFQVNAPFERTWSCLEETSEPCWACRGCRAREAAFQQAGKPDPLRVVRKV
ncbi:MAG: 7-cyano-7-deazaguanine synthase [Tepidisphaeraceae bacterium]